MASVIVYPGGGVDDDDFIVAESPRVHASRELWKSTHSKAHAIAALREAFEESGLLATEFAKAPSQKELDELRFALLDEEINFGDVLTELDSEVQLDEIWYFDRWVTPPWETKRYDTWFFLARAPEGQRFYTDGQEVTDERWLTPKEALERYRKRELILSPPTWATMRDLAPFDTFDDAAVFAKRAKPYAICPHFTPLEKEGTGVILLPGDPNYPDFEGVDTTIRGRPTRTRIGMRDGQWYDFEPPE